MNLIVSAAHRLYSLTVRRKFLTVTVIGLSVALTGCAATPGKIPTNTNPTPVQQFDPSLIPTTAPADALKVEPAIFLTSVGEYGFRVGSGPTWCTFNPDQQFVICEQNEADATYDAVSPPSSCKLSYGYQSKLTEAGKAGTFTCSSGLYADPAHYQSLNAGETLTVGNLTCFVTDITARCDNQNGNYIVLGPEVWALG